MRWLNSPKADCVAEISRLTKIIQTSNAEAATWKEKYTKMANQLTELKGKSTKRTRVKRNPNQLIAEMLPDDHNAIPSIFQEPTDSAQMESTSTTTLAIEE